MRKLNKSVGEIADEGTMVIDYGGIRGYFRYSKINLAGPFELNYLVVLVFQLSTFHYFFFFPKPPILFIIWNSYNFLVLILNQAITVWPIIMPTN